MNRLRLAALSGAAVLAMGLAACGDDDNSSTASTSGSGGDAKVSGSIRIDGSSTVAPLTEAIAEQFMGENPDVRITVGTSGTGGGFEKFCQGETDANDASDAIDEETEAACRRGGVEWEELQVANDALTVVANPENPISCLTTDQLRQIWGANSKVKNWNEVTGTDPRFDAELAAFGPGTDSGTFAYFTETVDGEEGAQRTDYNNVGEDDNQTVTGVAGAPGGIGYFGFSFFQENSDKLRALEIDGGSGCVAPSAETVQDGTYRPLARPLFIYPSARALRNPAFDAFMEYYLANVNSIAEQVGFIGLTDAQLADNRTKLDRLVGSAG
ncbi:PstS family phosphate ABC transporter substrate-binding protein [Conexibacter woesei]|uniref:Phosphate-binding protein n=1 Tax=Conexibacter woesei (strain DSM 14684 / CCUG 47730 / CIP 108061 / JCM 11494 / NBRC 100937 / ID131577) TaxID=469383 RepID=D3F811_CONWI|nr:PstS family phosphate ABC transporter substrate-binding protein [Conexibacter woesei]ADB52905.1 phosphate binding protein [Conexibacter woesei DSM 14684]